MMGQQARNKNQRGSVNRKSRGPWKTIMKQCAEANGQQKKWGRFRQCSWTPLPNNSGLWLRFPWDHCLAQALWSEACRLVWGPGHDATRIALWQELQAEFSLIQLRVWGPWRAGEWGQVQCHLAAWPPSPRTDAPQMSPGFLTSLLWLPAVPRTGEPFRTWALAIRLHLVWILFHEDSRRATQYPFQLSLSHVQLFVTPWTAAHQASLSFTISWNLLKLMFIESVMPSNHLILCCSLLLLPSIYPRIKVFSNELAPHIRWPKYWSFSFSISPFNEYLGLFSFRDFPKGRLRQ